MDEQVLTRICYNRRKDMKAVMGNSTHTCNGNVRVIKNGVRVTIPLSALDQNGQYSEELKALMSQISIDKPEILEKLENRGISTEIVA